ncbi:uncharacterized protein A1O9_09056 [Exophiala aquamarina CBS 119918]|uniref:Uncharacterized protein n=1 Tax=Exophiala aquamarina CBS 119918 TaxID=1182545 RepID=A0A072P3A9_9EURO|nr:uncharacterized protein A1O9_09056 [Exophiala aquamarina CBS 119918]KEF54614.1 hypothetical protein A1O9_09056 [Exophiala aquamarina CBS 119918]
MVEPIAVVGFSFRLPGDANTPDRLWELLANGEQAWTDVPESRYRWQAFHSADQDGRGTHNARGGFFLKQDIAEFDAKFFGIPDTEAAAIDPQQRLLLEVSYEALENAGMPIETLRGSQTGVYIALVSRDYDRQIYKDPSQIPKHHLTGCGDAVACGRISYTFDFKGPCMAIDTGCSGGMVGVHLACQALRLGESDMALVGGSNLLLGPDMTIAMSNLHMLNENGRCYPFDSRGAGYGRAEGVAVLVLKRLSDAERDDDAIRAVILSSGVGQDGKTNGILLPNSNAQQQLAANLYKRGGYDPQRVAYVEMHGTGTAAGDSAEIRSIRQVFVGDGSRRQHPLNVGSIKSNLGHSESTSGLSGIISAILSMERSLIPPVAALKVLKPDVSLMIDDGKIQIPQRVQDWPAGSPRLASVNSFGFGGTNAHVILEGYSKGPNAATHYLRPASAGVNGCLTGNGPSGNEASSSYQDETLEQTHLVNGSYADTETPFLLVITAKSKESLKAMVEGIRSWVKIHGSEPSALFNLSKTLAIRRSAFNWRASVVGRRQSEIIAGLGTVRPNKAFASPKPVFLFTGQGAQYATMGRDLLHLKSAFLYSLQKSQAILHGLGASWDLIDELRKPEPKSRINSSQVSQPATTAIQIALIHLLAQLGVRPAAVLGHSSGEVAAAYAAGMLSHEAALQIAYHKGFVADWCRASINGKGAMLAVGLGETDATRYLDSIFSGRASVACVNSPSSVTISGDEAAVIELKTALDKDSIFNRRLKVDIAYHSHHMLAVATEFEKSIMGLTASAPSAQTKFFSSVKGQQNGEATGALYWVDNLISKVRFSEGLEQLASLCGKDNQPLTFIEVGPHSALEGPVRQTMAACRETYNWSYSPTLVRNRDACQAVVEMSGRIWEQGVAVNLSESTVVQNQTHHYFRIITNLPAYPWDHSKRYWHESRLSKDYRFRQHPPHDLLGLQLVGTTAIEPVFRLILSVDDLPWLQEHMIDGFALYPGSAFLVHAIEGIKQLLEGGGERKTIKRYHLKNVKFTKSIVVPDSPGTVELLLSLGAVRETGERLGISWYNFRITSLAAEGAWNDNCHGLIGCEFAPEVRVDEKKSRSTSTESRVDELADDCFEQIKTSDLYAGLRQNGIDYGENFSIIRTLKMGSHLAIGTIQIPNIARCMPSGQMKPHVIHPTTFDAFMHIALPLYHRFCSEGPVMLTSIGEASIAASISNKPGDRLTILCDLRQVHPKFGAVNVSILQEDSRGEMIEVGSLTNEEFRGIGDGSSKIKSTTAEANGSYIANWVPAQRTAGASKDLLHSTLQLCSFNPIDAGSGLVEELVGNLTERFGDAIIPWSRDLAAPSAIQVVFEDSSTPKPSIADMKMLFSQTKSVLWLTIYRNDDRDFSVRSLAQDLAIDHGVHLVSLEYHDGSRDADLLGDLIVEVITTSFIKEDNAKIRELKFKFERGALFVPRLQRHEASDRWLKPTSEAEFEEVLSNFHCENPLKLHFKTTGLLGSARFVPNVDAESPTEPEEIKVKVYAHGVNRSDVAVASARGSPTDSMVGEFAGVVVEVGSAARSRYSPGDRVCGWGATPYASIVRVRHGLVQHIDDSISFEQGAAIPLAFQTAFHALVDIANLKTSQRILIHGAAGAVGQAAISIAQQLGAYIYATVGSEDKAIFLTEKAALSRHCIFSNRDTKFQKQINQLTGGQGVDVVLNCSSGDLLEPSVACTAELGVIISVVKSNVTSQMPSRDQNISYANVNMNALKTKFPELLSDIFGKAIAMYKAGPQKCPSINVMPISDLEKAFRLVKTEKYVGKVVLVSDDDAYVQQEIPLIRPMKLDKTATYGVLGASPSIEQSLREFLVDRGAGNTVSLAFTDLDTLSVQPPIKGIIYIEPTVGASCIDIAHRSKLWGELFRQHKPDFVLTLSQDIQRTKQAITWTMQTNVKSSREEGNIVHHEPRDFILRTANIDQLECNDQVSINQNPSRRQTDLYKMIDFLLNTGKETRSPTELFMVPREMGNLGLRNALFTDIVKAEQDSTADENRSESTTLENKLRQASDLETARCLLASVVCDQLATFCAVDRDDIRLDTAIVDVGLDSLLAIEFKNWIMRTLQAPMQTTEILDASSLKDLVLLISQRSELVRSGSEDTNGLHVNGNSERPTMRTPTEGKHPDHSAGVLPPPLPLPKLEDLIERHLSSIRPFASDEEFSNSLRLAAEFRAEGGPGARLYERMQALKAGDPENWYHDLFLNNQYLCRPGPLAPYTLFFFTHPISEITHSQSERSALIASTLIRYKKNLEKGTIKPRYMNEQPLCMDLYKNLFSACREPKADLDVFEAHPGNDFFVVLRRGHAYKIDVASVDDRDMFSQLEATFTSILNIDLKDVDWLGILSGEHRNNWAQNYRDFLYHSTQNLEYIQTIQRSAFIICLDERSPENAEQRARQVHFGDGSNRWFDKSIQYIVCSNGISGILADHTGLDAPTVADINLSIARAIRGYSRSSANNMKHALPFKKVVHTSFVGYESNVQRVRVKYLQTIAKRQHFFTSLNCGSSFMRKYKVPPNSVFQLVVQLAARHFFGYVPACWETVLQTIFHKGRVEINQVVSVEVAEFVNAAADETTPLSLCRQKLIEAARRHSGNILAATRSGGFDRFLSLLREIGKDGEKDLELYKDPPYTRSRPRKIMSSCFKTHMAENGCVQRDDDSIWLHFEVESDSVKFSGLGEAGQTDRFVEDLQRAAKRVREILLYDGMAN